MKREYFSISVPGNCSRILGDKHETVTRWTEGGWQLGCFVEAGRGLAVTGANTSRSQAGALVQPAQVYFKYQKNTPNESSFCCRAPSQGCSTGKGRASGRCVETVPQLIRIELFLFDPEYISKLWVFGFCFVFVFVFLLI